MQQPPVRADTPPPNTIRLLHHSHILLPAYKICQQKNSYFICRLEKLYYLNQNWTRLTKVLGNYVWGAMQRS